MYKKNNSHFQIPLTSHVDELPEKLQKGIKEAWSGTFYEEFFCRIDETPFAVLYADCPSRPNIPVNVLVSLEFLKAGHGWTDEQLYENNLYVIIKFRVTRIEGVHLVDFGYEGEEPVLYDDQGQSYNLRYARFEVRFRDPSHLTSGYEIDEGGEGIFIYEIPEDRKLASLDLIYTYRESWDDDSPLLRGFLPMLGIVQ